MSTQMDPEKEASSALRCKCPSHRAHRILLKSIMMSLITIKSYLARVQSIHPIKMMGTSNLFKTNQIEIILLVEAS